MDFIENFGKNSTEQNIERWNALTPDIQQEIFTSVIKGRNTNIIKFIADNVSNKLLTGILDILINDITEGPTENDEDIEKIDKIDMIIIKLLVDKGAKINESIVRKSSNITDQEYIHYIFSHIDFDIVKPDSDFSNMIFNFITSGNNKNININDITKIVDKGIDETRMPTTVINYKEIVEYLINHSFNFNYNLSYGRFIKDISTLDFLISKGYDVTKDISIFENKNIDIIKHVLNLRNDNGGKLIDINSEDTRDTIFHAPGTYDHTIKLLTLLTVHGFNLNFLSDGQTFLSMAVYNIQYDLVKFLLEKGSIASFSNNLAIKTACEPGSVNLNIIKLLLDNGATLTQDCISNLKQSNDPAVKIFLKDYIKPMDIDKLCNYDLDLLGDPLKEKGDIVLFNIEGNKQCECITYSDWKNILDNQDKKYLWSERRKESPLSEPLKYCRIFKLPFSGVYIQSTYNLLLRYNTFKLLKFDAKQLVSPNKIEEVYKAVPIKRYDMIKEITEGVKANVNALLFRPTFDDIQINSPPLAHGIIITTLAFFGTFIEMSLMSGIKEVCFSFTENRNLKNFKYTSNAEEGEEKEREHKEQEESKEDQEEHDENEIVNDDESDASGQESEDEENIDENDSVNEEGDDSDRDVNLGYGEI